MRDLKGDWRDLFNGFMLGLDLRKMFLAFCGIIFTVFGIGAVTAIIGNTIDAEYVQRPSGFLLHKMYATVAQSWHVIYTGTPGHEADWKIYVPYSIFAILAFLVIWSYFGGAICRIAAYEIAKDGERIETAKALRFASKKFWSFFWAPLICVIGFGFFFLCNFVGGLIGKLLDIIPYVGVIGAPLVAILLPLAILSGFIMTLILLGTVAGSSLFAPAVAAEGTDSFDSVSRGFSYVYSRPWHFVWYQGVSAVYGYVCIAFVILFAITMSHIGIKAGSAGFDLFGVWHKGHFDHISDASWNMILADPSSPEYRHSTATQTNDPVLYARHLPKRMIRQPGDLFVAEPYWRLQRASNKIVRPDRRWNVDNVGSGVPSIQEIDEQRRELEGQWKRITDSWRVPTKAEWDRMTPETQKDYVHQDDWKKLSSDEKKRYITRRQEAALPELYRFGLDAVGWQQTGLAGQAFILIHTINPQFRPNDKAELAESHIKKLGYKREVLKDPKGQVLKDASGNDLMGWVGPAKKHDHTVRYVSPPAANPAGHKVATYILSAWLIVILGLALGYPVAYFFSQQTMIYFVLRKKVDGIEMNEVFEETEEEEKMPEPIAPPRPSEPAAPLPPEKPMEGKAPEPPKA